MSFVLLRSKFLTVTKLKVLYNRKQDHQMIDDVGGFPYYFYSIFILVQF